MIVTLMGFMGSGKTSIGRLVAKIMKVKFIDLDHVIIEKEGQSIAAIFEQHGEAYFRALETKYLKKIVKKNEFAVLALGGGAACNPINWKYLDKTQSIYLKRSATYLFDNLKAKKAKRPLIQKLSDKKLKKFIESRMLVREDFYSKANLFIGGNSSKKDLATIIAFAACNLDKN